MKHLDITVKGKVQGVQFRASAKAVADQLGVRGTVRNDPNGDVIMEAEGEPTMLDLFLDWVNEGPQGAQVTTVESSEGESKNYRNFEVLKRGLFK
ncbi:acylphosphatase [Mucilaginibacter antarcticus]|uniref:acylphosphatase n=1 Tax=Mucilaginibacter antarcticus TaxID=1855725 RepID=A0ABW5XLT9_9SPHI